MKQKTFENPVVNIQQNNADIKHYQDSDDAKVSNSLYYYEEEHVIKIENNVVHINESENKSLDSVRKIDTNVSCETRFEDKSDSTEIV